MKLRARPSPLSVANAVTRWLHGSGRLVSSMTAMLALVVVAGAANAQGARATITGVVKDATSGAPVAGVTVSIPGTTFQTTTDDRGRYELKNVPQGNQTIDAKRVGYAQAHDENVRINSASVVHDISVNQVALTIAAITTSATVDPTTGIKSPYAVSKVTQEMMPVPTTGVANALNGKVSAVTVTKASGSTNGEESWIQIRSISSPFKDNSPLFVVDGVPLNMTNYKAGNTAGPSGVGNPLGSTDIATVRTSDIEGLDIESIEVIKGAAAAALYGSQAAGGVISIKTRRGNDVGLGRSQLEVRTDYGFDQIAKMPDQRIHHYINQNDKQQWQNGNGDVVPRTGRFVDPDRMYDNEYAVNYHPLEQAFVTNRNLNNTVRVSQNSAASNFQLSYTRTRNPGTMREAYGALNQSVRVNVDHQLRDNIQLSVSATHGRNNNIPTVANFSTLFAFDPDVNLLAPGDQRGTKYRISPDSGGNSNPLYNQTISGNSTRRTSTQVNGNAQYRPLNWLTVVGNVGYNRQDQIRDNFSPPGLPSNETSGFTTGSLSYTEAENDALSGFTSATFLRDIGALTMRLTAQAEANHKRSLTFQATGTQFTSVGSQTLAAATTKDNSSTISESRLNSWFSSLALDYGGKYVGDFLFRREGSSLYGPRYRFNNFYRASGAWLMSQEAWYPGFLSNLTLSKLRYSYGTSGTQPDFRDQFETVQLNNSGFVRSRLGNQQLKPEKKFEHELGGDFIYKNRVSVSLTYSKSVTKDAIVEIEAPNVTGFNTFTRNAGATHGYTMEGSLEGSVMKTKNFTWTMTGNASHSKSAVDYYGRTCYTETPSFLYVCDGVPITSYWGNVIMRSKSDLAPSRRGTLDAWEVDDRGYLVPVGVGNHWWEGMSKSLWGTNVVIDGQTYLWGVPEPQWNDSASGQTYANIGSWQTNLDFGYGNRFNYKNVQVYFLFTGYLGGQIYDDFRNTQESNLDARSVDQTGVPDSLKKAYLYWPTSTAGSGAGLSYGTANDQYVEPLTFAKLQELQLQYSMSSKQHQILNKIGADRIIFELDGTNLFRFDGGYKGLDQEGFYTLSGQQKIRLDTFRYPLARQFTTSLSVVF